MSLNFTKNALVAMLCTLALTACDKSTKPELKAKVDTKTSEQTVPSTDAKPAQAEASGTAKPAPEAVAKKIESDLPLIFSEPGKVVLISQINATPFKDMYEVVLKSKEVVYTNENVDYAFYGHLIDAKSRQNLTQARMNELEKINFNDLPAVDSLISTRGNGSRKIAIFEDPNCGYCKLFRKQLDTVKDITVYTYVVDILGEKSKVLAKNLLCTENASQAWDDWMKSNKEPAKAAGDCDSSKLERNDALAQKIGVTGTPTIIFEDGSRISGFAEGDAFNQKLDAVKKTTSP